MFGFHWSLCAFSMFTSFGHDTCSLQHAFGFVWFRCVIVLRNVVCCVVLCVVRSFCLSQRCVDVGYALRVFPAVTRLTVYSRPQVLACKQLCNLRAHVCVKVCTGAPVGTNFVKKKLLWGL